MQPLSIWLSRTGCWVMPQLDIDASSSSTKTWRTSKIWHGNCSGSEIGNRGLVFVSTISRGFKTGDCGCINWYSGCQFFTRCRSFKLFVFHEPDRISLDTSYALAWTLEEPAIGNLVVKEKRCSLDGSSGYVGGEAFSNVEQDEIEASGLPAMHDDNDDKYGKVESDMHEEEDLGEEKSAKVDVRSLAWRLRLAKTEDDVEEVLKDKGELPLQVYSSMIRGFGKEKLLHSAIALVEWLKKRKKSMNGYLGPNLFIYNSLLGAVKQAKEFDEVEKVINDMSMEGVQPNVVTYNTLMGIYLEQGRVTDALNIFYEIQKKNLSPSPASYSTALLAYRRLENGFGALNFFIDVKEKYCRGEIGEDKNEDWKNEIAKLENFTVRICYQVMRRWLVNTENLSTKVLKLLIKMDKSGLPMSRAEHERLVWACTRVEHYVVAKELYSRIRERNTEISLSVCNHVIWLMGKAKKWWEALKIYENLLDEGPKPNNMTHELIVSHFNILLTAARKRGIWRWGVTLLNKMEEKGLKPGSREWNAVLVACSKASETSIAVHIFRRMVEQGEKPTIVSYGALLSALEKGRLYDEALQVWKHMIKVGVEPNLYAYTIMASIYAAQGKFNIVDSIILEMSKTGVEPTVVTFNAIISGCAHKSMGSAAYKWFQRMKVENISPNEVTFEILIDALATDGKPRLAYELYLRAHVEGLNLSSKAYDAVIESSQVFGASIDLSALGPRPSVKKKKMQIIKMLSSVSNFADVPKRSAPFEEIETSTSHTENHQ